MAPPADVAAIPSYLKKVPFGELYTNNYQMSYFYYEVHGISQIFWTEYTLVIFSRIPLANDRCLLYPLT